MARLLELEMPERTPEPDVDREIADLLRLLHERGILRLAHNFLGALPEIGGIVARGLNSPGTVNAVGNLALLFEMLGRVPPSDLARILAGLSAALERLGQTPEERTDAERRAAAPGLRGALGLLRDEALWQGLAPVLDALRAFGATMRNQEPTTEERHGGGPNI